MTFDDQAREPAGDRADQQPNDEGGNHDNALHVDVTQTLSTLTSQPSVALIWIKPRNAGLQGSCGVRVHCRTEKAHEKNRETRRKICHRSFRLCMCGIVLLWLV